MDPTTIGIALCSTLCCILVLVVLIVVVVKLMKKGKGDDDDAGAIGQEGPESPFARSGPEVGPLPGARPAGEPAAKPPPAVAPPPPAVAPTPVVVQPSPTLDPHARTQQSMPPRRSPTQENPTQKVAPVTGSPVAGVRQGVADPSTTVPEPIQPPTSRNIAPKPRTAPRGDSAPPPPPKGLSGLQPINPADARSDEAATVMLKRPPKKPD